MGFFSDSSIFLLQSTSPLIELLRGDTVQARILCQADSGLVGFF